MNDPDDKYFLPNDVPIHHFQEPKKNSKKEIPPIYDAIFKFSYSLFPGLHATAAIAKLSQIILFLQRFKIISYLTSRDFENQIRFTPLHRIINLVLTSSTENKSPFIYLTLCIVSAISICLTIAGIYKCYYNRTISYYQSIFFTIFTVYLPHCILLPLLNECTRLTLKTILKTIMNKEFQLILEIILILGLLFLTVIHYSTIFNSTLFQADISITRKPFIAIPICFIGLSFLEVTSEFILNITQVCILFSIIFFFCGVFFLFSGLSNIYIHENGNVRVCALGCTFLFCCIHSSLKAAGIDCDEICVYLIIVVLVFSLLIFKTCFWILGKKRAKKLQQVGLEFEKLNITGVVQLLYFMQSGFNNGIRSAIDGSFLEWGTRIYGIEELFYILMIYATILRKAPFYMSFLSNFYSKAYSLAEMYKIYEYEAIKNARIVRQVTEELRDKINDIDQRIDSFNHLEIIFSDYLSRNIQSNHAICYSLYSMRNILKNQVEDLLMTYPNSIAAFKIAEKFYQDVEENPERTEELKKCRNALNNGDIHISSAFGHIPYSMFPNAQSIFIREDQDVELDSSDDEFNSYLHSKTSAKSSQELFRLSENGTDKPYLLSKNEKQRAATSKAIINMIRVHRFTAFLLFISILLLWYSGLNSFFNIDKYERWEIEACNLYSVYMITSYQVLLGSLQIKKDITKEEEISSQFDPFSTAKHNLLIYCLPSKFSKNNARFSFLMGSNINPSAGNYDNQMNGIIDKLIVLIRTEGEESPELISEISRRYQVLISMSMYIPTFLTDAIKNMTDTIVPENKNLFLYFFIPTWFFELVLIYLFLLAEYGHYSAVKSLTPKKNSALLIGYLKKHYRTHLQQIITLVFLYILFFGGTMLFFYLQNLIIQQNTNEIYKYSEFIESEVLTTSEVFHLLAATELSEFIEAGLVDRNFINSLIYNSFNFFTNGTSSKIVRHDRIDQSPYAILAAIYNSVIDGTFVAEDGQNSQYRLFFNTIIAPAFIEKNLQSKNDQLYKMDTFMSNTLVVAEACAIILFFLYFCMIYIHISQITCAIEFPYLIEKLNASTMQDLSSLETYQAENMSILDFIKKPAALTIGQSIIQFVNDSWLARIDNDEDNTIGNTLFDYKYSFEEIRISNDIVLAVVSLLPEEELLFNEAEELEDKILNLRKAFCPSSLTLEKSGIFSSDFCVLLLITFKFQSDIDEFVFKEHFSHYLHMAQHLFHLCYDYDILKGSPFSLLALFGFNDQTCTPESIMTEVIVFAISYVLKVNESKFTGFDGALQVTITCGETHIQIREDSLGDIVLDGVAAAKLMQIHPYNTPNSIIVCPESAEILQKITSGLPYGLDIIKVNEFCSNINFNYT